MWLSTDGWRMNDGVYSSQVRKVRRSSASDHDVSGCSNLVFYSAFYWQPWQIHKKGFNMFVLGSFAGKTSSVVSSSHAHTKLCLQVFDGFFKISVSQKWKWKSYHSFVSLSIVLIMNDLHFTGTFPRLITYKPDKVNNRNLSSLSGWAFFLQVEARAAFVNWY